MRISIALFILMMSTLLIAKWNVLVGYYGSDGGCEGKPYATINVSKTISITLSKADGCFNCGCDSLAWLGLSALSEGKYVAVVTFKVIKFEGVCCKLAFPFLGVVEESALYSTGYAGARPSRLGIQVTPAKRIWDCVYLDEDVERPELKVDMGGQLVIFPLSPCDLMNKNVTVGLYIDVRKTLLGYYKVSLLKAWVYADGKILIYNSTDVSEYFAKPWISFHVRTGLVALARGSVPVYNYTVNILNITVARVNSLNIYNYITTKKVVIPHLCMHSVQYEGTIIENWVLEPYLELEQLYKIVSNSTSYKALILKNVFQRNVFYLTQLSSLASIISRLLQFYNDLEYSLNKVKVLMNEKPSLRTVFELMSLLQRAKVDIALIRLTLMQAQKMKEKMVNSKPAQSCKDAMKILKGILNSKNLRELIEWRKKAKEYGGLDAVVKCAISEVIDRISSNFEKFAKMVDERLKTYNEEIARLEEEVKLLNLSS